MGQSSWNVALKPGEPPNPSCWMAPAVCLSARERAVYICSAVLAAVYGTNQTHCRRGTLALLAVSLALGLMTLALQCVLVESSSEHLEQI